MLLASPSRVLPNTLPVALKMGMCSGWQQAVEGRFARLYAIAYQAAVEQVRQERQEAWRREVLEAARNHVRAVAASN